MSDLDENLTSILSSIVENECIDHPHSLGAANNGLNLPSLTGASANDEIARQKDIESITKSLQRAEDQLKQSQLQQQANANNEIARQKDIEKITKSLQQSQFEQQANGCETLVPSLSTELLSSVLDDSDAIAELIANEPIKEIVDSVLGVSIAFDHDLDGLIVDKQPLEQCAMINLPEIHELTLSIDENAQFTEKELGIIHRTGIVQSHGENGGNCVNPSYEECEAIIENVEISSDFTIFNEQSEDTACVETITADRISSNKSSKDTHNYRPERRRICVYNDSDSESEDLNIESPVSDEIGEPQTAASDTSDKENSEKLQNSDPSDIENEYVSLTEPSSSESDTNDDEYTIVIPNERPGPKSKKKSTLLSAALKAKSLLQSAVVIPSDKKKKQIIESDDESTAPAAIGVDDIGLIGDDNATIPVNVAFEREDDNNPPVPKRKFVSRIQRGIGSSEPFLIKMVRSEPGEERPRRPPINRMQTRIKFEQSEEYDNRTACEQSEPGENDAIFDVPLNAPYVDTSSGDDYFVKNETCNQQAGPSSRPNSMLPQIQKKKGHIPDDVYFNSTVPLNVLYSYDASSSEEEQIDSSPETVRQVLARMPPVHKIRVKTNSSSKRSHRNRKRANGGGGKETKKIPQRPSVYTQLDELKRLVKLSGLKVNVNELVKGSKTFQERCDRIKEVFKENGVIGEPTISKCRRLKKRLKLKEEIANLDSNVIIESNEDDGRPTRSTRQATKRNYTFDENDEQPQMPSNTIDADSPSLLNRVKQVVDSDTDDEIDIDNTRVTHQTIALEVNPVEAHDMELLHANEQSVQCESPDLSLLDKETEYLIDNFDISSVIETSQSPKSM